MKYEIEAVSWYLLIIFREHISIYEKGIFEDY